MTHNTVIILQIKLCNYLQPSLGDIYNIIITPVKWYENDNNSNHSNLGHRTARAQCDLTLKTPAYLWLTMVRVYKDL